MIRTLLVRLRRWLRARMGGSEPAAGPGFEGTSGPGTYDYECTSCGTGVDHPDDDCPLCSSSAVVAADAGPAGAAGAATGGPAGTPGAATGRETGPSTSGAWRHLGARPTGRRGTRRPAEDTADAGTEREGRATALAPGASAVGAVRQHAAAGGAGAVEERHPSGAERDLLARHADRWEPHRGGYRVETASGTRIVDSREEVVALLRALEH